MLQIFNNASALTMNVIALMIIEGPLVYFWITFESLLTLKLFLNDSWWLFYILQTTEDKNLKKLIKLKKYSAKYCSIFLYIFYILYCSIFLYLIFYSKGQLECARGGQRIEATWQNQEWFLLSGAHTVCSLVSAAIFWLFYKT